MPVIPLALAAPAAATSLAYLNARWSLFYDFNVIGSLIKTRIRRLLSERRDRLNLFYILENHALNSSTAGRPFLVYDGKTWTFHEVYQNALRYGAWIKKTYDIKPGDIFAMDFMNSAAFIFIWMGLWSIGASPAFINYNLVKSSLEHCVKVSTARVLFVDEEVAESKLPPEQITTLSSPNFREDGGSVEVVIYNKELESRILETDPVREPDSCRANQVGSDIAMLIYTSGTTGLPKPAIVSWNKCFVGGSFIGLWMGLQKSDRVYTCMPLYHSTAAILGYLACMITGTSVAIGRRFSARKFWKEVRNSEATVVQYVGETLRYLLANAPEIDPVTGENLDSKNNVRMLYGNGLRPDIWNRVKERFGVDTISEFYASTEGTSGSWNKSSNNFSAGAIGRNGALAEFLLGKAFAIVEIDHTTEAPWRDPKTGFCKKTLKGEPGELLYVLNADNIKGDFQGYFNNDKATDGKVLRNVFANGDAWFRTGDIIRWDKEGRWYFSDRIGDTFRWRSENVSTSEVAEVLGSHPAVNETNVYGVAVPHTEGRAGCASIVFKDQIELAESSTSSSAPIPILEPTASVLQSLASHAFANLPKYAVPIFLRVTREVQTTGNNKHQKHVLRTEGVDMDILAEKKIDDRVYWLRDGTYVPFGLEEWKQLKAGNVKL